MKITIEHPVKKVSILDIEDGGMFQLEDGDIGIRTDEGWLIIGETELTTYADCEYQEYKEVLESVTPRPDLDLEVIVRSAK